MFVGGTRKEACVWGGTRKEACVWGQLMKGGVCLWAGQEKRRVFGDRTRKEGCGWGGT